MRQPNQTADQGSITKYSIELNGTKPSLRKYEIKNLKPYTVYSVKVANQGNIAKYPFERNGMKTSLRNYNMTGLKPYTNYTVRVMASSKIGNSKWSEPVTFTTQQSG